MAAKLLSHRPAVANPLKGAAKAPSPNGKGEREALFTPEAGSHPTGREGAAQSDRRAEGSPMPPELWALREPQFPAPRPRIRSPGRQAV